MRVSTASSLVPTARRLKSDILIFRYKVNPFTFPVYKVSNGNRARRGVHGAFVVSNLCLLQLNYDSQGIVLRGVKQIALKRNKSYI